LLFGKEKKRGRRDSDWRPDAGDLCLYMPKGRIPAVHLLKGKQLRVLN